MNSSRLQQRVLHVITTIARGGAENHLFELVRGQVERGWIVTVAYLKDPPGDHYWRSSLEDIGVKVVFLNVRHTFEISSVFGLRKLIDDFLPHILHAHLPLAEIYSLLSLLGNKTLPFIISKHNDEVYFEGPLRYLEYVALYACARRATSIIAISSAVKQFFKKRWHQSIARKIIVIHYGIQTELFENIKLRELARLRTDLGLGPHDVVVGTIARLTKQKALNVMIRGFATASKKSLLSYKLLIAGRGELEKDLKQLCVSLDIDNKVLFLGFREDIPELINVLDIFALTSNYEGFGLVLLEAMAAGKPVIATRVSAIPEVVSHGKTGLLIDKGNDEHFADALHTLSNENFRQFLGRAGKKRVINKFSLSKMVESTLTVYMSHINNNQTHSKSL